MKTVIISVIEYVNILDFNKIEKILNQQGIYDTDDNYEEEYEYRKKFEFKKYLLGKYFNWELPINFINMVDKMEYVLLDDVFLNKKYKIIL